MSPPTSFWKLSKCFPHGTVACKRKKFFRNGVGYIGQGVKGTGIPPKFRGCCFGLHPRYCGTEVYHGTAVLLSLYEYNMVYTQKLSRTEKAGDTKGSRTAAGGKRS